MSHHEMGHHTDEKSAGKSAKSATDPATKQTVQGPKTPGEASGSGQEATRGSTSGEKQHGEKLQSAGGSPTGSQGASPSGGRHH